MLFAHVAEDSPNATAAEKAVSVYRHAMEIEVYAVAVAIAFAFVFGHLYEVWSRRAVLCMSFALLGFSMFLPKLGIISEGQTMFAISRIFSCCLV